MNKSLIALIGLIFTLPNIAFAHDVAGGGFMAGMSHPILGFDHLLAMLSVGVLSAQMGGKAIWTVPTTFVFVMLLGGVLGMKGVQMMPVELGIAMSVFALGVSIAVAKKLPAFIAMIFVGFFAIFHGVAHGAEMPYLAQPAYYAAGFVVGTAAIHIAGVAVGVLFKMLRDGPQILRYLGASIAGIGFYLTVI